ncbi:MAG: hypothetical protein HY400_00075, partial [Elusimicrobia bacterium]|nr:hypothetical protein [Elusimicrobiota bacterium]
MSLSLPFFHERTSLIYNIPFKQILPLASSLKTFTAGSPLLMRAQSLKGNPISDLTKRTPNIDQASPVLNHIYDGSKTKSFRSRPLEIQLPRAPPTRRGHHHKSKIILFGDFHQDKTLEPHRLALMKQGLTGKIVLGVEGAAFANSNRLARIVSRKTSM